MKTLIDFIASFLRVLAGAFKPSSPEYLAVAVVEMEDAPLHTDLHPFCSDVSCPCHKDEDLVAQVLLMPLADGLLTPDEADRIFAGLQI